MSVPATSPAPTHPLRPVFQSMAAAVRRRRPADVWIRLALVAAAFAVALVLLFVFEVPFEAKTSSVRLGADSHTYYALADLVRTGQGDSLVFLGYSANLIGPLVLALVLQKPLLILVFNSLLFLFAVRLAARSPGVSASSLAVLLLLNATTVVSIATLNKEILTLTATLMLCRYIYQEPRSRLLLFAMLAVGMLARWQQPVLTLLFLFFYRRKSVFCRHPWLGVGLVVAFITIAYPPVARMGAAGLDTFLGEAAPGGGLIILNNLQASYGFPLVVLPKSLMMLFNRLLTPTYWFTDYSQQDFTDLANQFIIHLHSLAMLAIIVAAFFRGRLSLRRPLIYFAALYLVVTAANVFVQPRYEYPIYVVLCFDLARAEDLTSPVFRYWSLAWLTGKIPRIRRLASARATLA